MSFKKIEEMRKNFSLHLLQDHAYTLHEFERTGSYDVYEKSTSYCMDVMRKSGFEKVERFTHKADGKSSAYDCIMPEAWESTGRSTLKIVSRDLPEYEKDLADTFRNPLEVTTYSAPTPEGGITGEVLEYASLDLEKTSVKGKWIFIVGRGSDLNSNAYRSLALAGAAGLVVTDFSEQDAAPNDVFWFNGQGYAGWYHEKEAPRLPVFSIAPRRAEKLLALMKKGKVTLHGEIKAKIYDGKIYTVTGVIPGESREEYVLLAHLYEPFLADNALGFSAACELGRLLKAGKTKLKKSLRVIFSMEVYGFAQYFKMVEGKHSMVAGLNMDSFCHMMRKIVFRRTPISNPFFGDWFYTDWYKKFLPSFDWSEIRGTLGDDSFPSDTNIGVPINWMNMPSGHFHHNSGHYFTVEWAVVNEMFPVFAASVQTLLSLDFKEDYAKRAPKELEKKAKALLQNKALSRYDRKIRFEAEYFRYTKILESWSKFSGRKTDKKFLEEGYKKLSAKFPTWEIEQFPAMQYRAMNIIPVRKEIGKPFSLARVPFEEKIRLGAVSREMWALFDGKRDLLQCVKMVEQEEVYPSPVTNDQIKKMIEELKYLEKYGYVELKKAFVHSKKDVENALKKLGVKKNMFLVVHSTFSSMGALEGGPEIFSSALMEKIGKKGLLLMPAFTFNLYDGGKSGKPFEYSSSPSTVGVLTESFRKMPDVLRSADPCHSFCAWGERAAEFVKDHHKVPTVSAYSPLGLLEKEDGYCMVISSLNAVTFMHVVESSHGAPCLGDRMEEYDGILSDGRKVRLRTWGWRKGECENCPAHRTEELYEDMRKRKVLKEVMLGNAHICLFKLSDYRKIYEKLLKECGCTKAKIRPRKTAATVKSDWDGKKGKVRSSGAFTEDLPEFN